MGNCMETCAAGGSKEEEVGGDGAHQEEVGSGIRVKMLLTREELEWLVLQLGQQKGEKRLLQDLIAHMPIKRLASGTTGHPATQEDAADDHRGVWKPSLESIMEAPEQSQSF